MNIKFLKFLMNIKFFNDKIQKKKEKLFIKHSFLNKETDYVYNNTFLQ